MKEQIQFIRGLKRTQITLFKCSFIFIWGITPQGVLLALHSGITLDGAQGNISGPRDWTSVYHMQGRHSTPVVLLLEPCIYSLFLQLQKSHPGSHTCKASALLLSYISFLFVGWFLGVILGHTR